MPSHVLDDAARQFRNSLDRQFNAKPRGEFRLRLSNVGKPLCQLWYEKNGAPAEPKPVSFPIRMALGDVVEIITVAVIQAAQIDVDAINEAGSITVGGQKINGTSDITIDGKVWDIKSASAFAFEQKYSNPYGYANLKAHDDFGYIAQGVGYSEALDKPFGGWIATDKSTGDMAILEVPEGEIETSRNEVIADIERKVRLLESPEFPGREFEDVPETYRKKETGNRILGKTCEWCPFRFHCWPNLKHLPQQASTAASPQYKYYTHIEADNV